MTKRQNRELFFKSIYMTEFLEEDEDYRDRIINFLEIENASDCCDELLKRMDRLFNNLPDIDKIIETYSEGWKLSRMAKVDLSLMRLCIFEMKYEGQSKGIAINEAVELAKEFGAERSYAFINGILGRVDV